MLKELKLTEGKCTGIPKILKGMQQNGSPVPEFYADDSRTALRVMVPIHVSFSDTLNNSSLSKISGAEISKKQLEVYKYIKKNPQLGYREVAERLKVTPSTIQKHLNALKNKQLIIHEGPNKGGYWKILKEL